MLQYAIKVAITAVTVVAISEIAKRSSTLGAVIASLPLTSLLAFLWLYGETGDADKVADLARGIFWYVLPSLVLFVAFPLLVAQGEGFWPSLVVSCVLTFAAYLAMTAILARFGITL
ncbi:MAG TPA: DUF3147 family protein [Hyphomicrobium sp.]|nr:DUF3147 family protein [Hyphomicrobium sp.]